MEDNIRLAGIENRLGSLTSDTGSLKADVGTIKSEVAELRRDVSSIKGGVKVLMWVVAAFMAGTCVILYTAGRAMVRDTAREAAMEVIDLSRQRMTTSIQFARFSLETRVKEEPLTFEWKLKEPLPNATVVSMVAEPLEPLIGVAFSAMLVDDGATCRIFATGDTAKMVAALPAGIDGKMTVVTAPTVLRGSLESATSR